jgi:hypothetical protein
MQLLATQFTRITSSVSLQIGRLRPVAPPAHRIHRVLETRNIRTGTERDGKGAEKLNGPSKLYPEKIKPSSSIALLHPPRGRKATPYEITVI